VESGERESPTIAFLNVEVRKKYFLKSKVLPVCCLMIPAFLLFLSPSFYSKPRVPEVRVKAAYVIPAPKGTTSGAFFTIVNSSSAQDTLYKVEADFAESAQLHESVKGNGMIGMKQVRFVSIPPKSSIKFEPGGYHVMLIGVKQDLKIGMKVTFKLVFKHGGKVVVNAVVRQ
jgi:copper(I)-binding protein